jgi:hypothetical protein
MGLCDKVRIASRFSVLSPGNTSEISDSINILVFILWITLGNVKKLKPFSICVKKTG